MKWVGRRQSGNVEDRRRFSGRGIAGIGGVGGIIIAVFYFLLGGDPSQLFNAFQQPDQQVQPAPSGEQDPMVSFVSVVLADTEDVWDSLFTTMGKTYEKPKQVLFSNAVQSACGFAQAATGPFYCSTDAKVYIDLDFLQELQRKLHANGDFAQAYIIAHEVGHHVQNLLGVMNRVNRMRSRMDERSSNELSVRLELQADFLAGVWAYHAQKMKSILEAGDVEEAVNAAGAVGDDRIQMKTSGHIVPDAFTHGTSAQRVQWFLRGFKTGDISKGDTFEARDL
jgi:predicted metalloprotease